MNIWLIIAGEPLPTDKDGTRLYRNGQLAEMLVKRGHKAIVWESVVNHMLKTKRAEKTTKINYAENHDIVLLDAPLYKKNVSLKRIVHNIKIASEFTRFSEKCELPDVIFCAFPIIELANAVTDFGKKHNIPVILDARDLWPDVFAEALPKPLQPFGKILFYPFERKAQKAFQKTTAITGITNSFVDWALGKASKKRDENLNQPFHLSYFNNRPNQNEIDKGNSFWDSLGIETNETKFIASMMGSLTSRSETDILVKAARNIPSDLRDKFRFVICGTGMEHDNLKALAKGYPHIIMPGWVGKAEIWTLLQRSSVGVLPYPSDQAGLDMSFPNKVGEYFSAGLPIISSLHGEVSRLLNKEKCGMSYPNLGVNELTKIFLDLEGSKDTLQKMSKNAKRVFEEQFDANKVYNNLCDFIERISKINTI